MAASFALFWHLILTFDKKKHFQTEEMLRNQFFFYQKIREIRFNERRAFACDPTAQIFCHFAIVCTFTVRLFSSSKKRSHFVRIRIVIFAPAVPG